VLLAFSRTSRALDPSDLGLPFRKLLVGAMRRREFIALVGCALTGRPLPAAAQQPANVRRIGFLTPRTSPVPPARDPFSEAFMRGMRELGYAEGANLLVAWRYADGDYARLAPFARELVEMNLPVIVAYGTAAARVLQKTTTTIPVVVAAAVDLVGAGIVASLARPGGNITGFSVIDVDISAKQLELLKTFSPSLSRVAILLNPGNPAHPNVLRAVQDGASHLGLAVVAVNAASSEAIAGAFVDAARQGAGAVIIAADAFLSGQGSSLAASALAHRLATISLYRDHVQAGCLISYGQDVAEFHRRAATYVHKILQGARPEDLPVEQPTKFDLVINSKTASVLGLPIPHELLVSADEIIE
jgi:putative ABC transport system substrate-binding protein